MLFSTYKRGLVGFYILAIVLGGILLYVFAAPIASLIYVGLLIVLGLISIPLNFWLLQKRLDDYGGRFPMPNMGLGMWGVDIVDDDAFPEGAAAAREYPDDTLPTGEPILRCPFCHAALRADAKFCDRCGERMIT